MSLPSLELVCVNYGSFEDAVKSTRHCMTVFDGFHHANLFHPKSEMQYEGEHFIQGEFELPSIFIITPKSKSQHLCFLKEVPQYLTCDFALSIQWDGFIIRPDLWDDRFFEYDYIAAPWPLQNIINPKHRIGSGGFCMFSKRMAKLWSEIGDAEIPNDWERGAVNRRFYEHHGMKFAPLELAAKFGKEHDLEDINIEEGETFGFHDFRINPEHREKYRKQVYG